MCHPSFRRHRAYRKLAPVLKPIAVRDLVCQRVEPLVVAIWIKNDGHTVVTGRGHGARNVIWITACSPQRSHSELWDRHCSWTRDSHDSQVEISGTPFTEAWLSCMSSTAWTDGFALDGRVRAEAEIRGAPNPAARRSRGAGENRVVILTGVSYGQHEYRVFDFRRLERALPSGDVGIRQNQIAGKD